MKKNNKIIIGAVSIISLVVIVSIIFWFPGFAFDEFNYIVFTYSDQTLNIVTDPHDLLEKKISQWTDVSAKFKNDSQTKCELIIQSDSLNTDLVLDANLDYGVLFPKNEDILISFCGISRQIYLK